MLNAAGKVLTVAELLEALPETCGSYAVVLTIDGQEFEVTGVELGSFEIRLLAPEPVAAEPPLATELIEIVNDLAESKVRHSVAERARAYIRGENR